MTSKLVIDHKVIREMLDKNPDIELEVQYRVLKTALEGRGLPKEVKEMFMREIKNGSIDGIAYKWGNLVLSDEIRSVLAKYARKIAGKALNERVQELLSAYKTEIQVGLDKLDRTYQDEMKKLISNPDTNKLIEDTVEKTTLEYMKEKLR